MQISGWSDRLRGPAQGFLAWYEPFPPAPGGDPDERYSLQLGRLERREERRSARRRSGGSGSARRRSSGPRTTTARRDRCGPVQRRKSLARPCAPLFLLFLAGGGRGRGRAVGLEDELAVGLVDQLAAVRLGPELARTVAAGPHLARHSDARARAVKLAGTATAAPDPAPLLPQCRQPLPSSSSSSSDDGKAGPRRGAARRDRGGEPVRRGAAAARSSRRGEERAALGLLRCTFASITENMKFWVR